MSLKLHGFIPITFASNVGGTILAHCRWEDICNFSGGLSMVNPIMVENLQASILKSYLFPHFHLCCDFYPHFYHSPIAPSF